MKTNRKTILIIDTEGSLCTSVQRMFSQTGAHILVLRDDINCLQRIKSFQPDLIVVNLPFPDTTGLALMQDIRCITCVPVIVVTGVDDPAQTHFLDAGADDVVSRPFHMDVFLARVRAVLRRADSRVAEMENALYDDGNLLFDPTGYRTMIGECCIWLTPTEFRLLAYLVENAGELCTFRQILENVWGSDCRDNHEYVHAFVWQLRHKLERDPKRPDYIRGVYNVGYRFQAHEYGELERATPVQ